MFSLKDNPWLRFFRVTNLPTVPGDALVGAALMMPPENATLPQALASGVGVLFLYMFGLADNDIVGARTDAVHAPERPIPRGEITPTAASLAALVCVLAASLLPNWIVGRFRPGMQMPLVWHWAMVALFCCIVAYNRLKWVWLMGVCRGLSVICGGLAAWVPDLHPYTQKILPVHWYLLASLVALASGWAFYVMAVTILSKGEERPSEGLGNRRYLLGLAAFLPLLGFVPIAYAPGVTPPSLYLFIRIFALPVAGCCCAFVAWCSSVAPLWLPHGPDERRRAVGKTIGALIYLQIGFMLIWQRPYFLVAAAGLWLTSRLVRRLVPQISGS